MRARAAALVLILLLAGCTGNDDPGPEPATPTPTPTGPPPPPPPPPPPAPGSVALGVNDTWRYVGGANGSEVTVATVRAVADGMVRLHSVTTRTDNATHTVNSTILADTLALAVLFDSALGFEVQFSPPLPILIPAADHEYRGNITVPTPFGVLAQPAFATVRFLGLENVTVPAGTFETYRYNATVTSSGIREFHQENELWFSPVARQAVKTIVDGELRELESYILRS